jgi:hypothetical protein
MIHVYASLVVFLQEDGIMFRKTVIGLLTVAALSMLSPTMASARGFHGGFRGGGFHGGFGGAGLALGAVGLGLGLAAAPYAYGYGYPYGYGSYAYYGGGCYLVPRRAWTPWGWRLRRVEVCD